MEMGNASQFQILPTSHNHYDLKPYCTEITSNDNKSDSGEKIPQPVMVNDSSPLLLKEQKLKMRSKNQAFLDFQKNLSNHLDIKSPSEGQYASNYGRRMNMPDGHHSIDMNPIMTVNSSVKSVIFKETPNASNTVPSSFVDNDYALTRHRKPSAPDRKSAQRSSIQAKNKLTSSRPGLSLYDISASGDFGAGDRLTQGNKSKTIVKNNVSVTQLNTVNIHPDPAKGIKASIGGEEFVMYRTNDLHTLNMQNKDDD